MRKFIPILIFAVFSVLLFAEYPEFEEVITNGWGNYSLFKQCTIIDIDNNGLLDVIVREGRVLDRWEQINPNSFELEIKERNWQNLIGINTQPVFVDLDNDGLLELIFEFANYYEDPWVIYKQVDANSCEFELLNDNYPNSNANWSGISEFVDFDDNGLMDCVVMVFDAGVGHHFNRYEQIAENSLEIQLIEADFISFYDNLSFVPRFLDMDNDNKLDMFAVIHDNPKMLWRYEQTETSYHFAIADTNFAELNSLYLPYQQVYDVPFIIDFNNDNKLDLIFKEPVVGSTMGTSNIRLYEQQEENSYDFDLVNDNLLDNCNVIGIDHKLIDFDHDGKLDLFTWGGYNDYLNHYEQTSYGSINFEFIETNFMGIDTDCESSNIDFMDTDGDGLYEIILMIGSSFEIYEQNSPESYEVTYIAGFELDNETTYILEKPNAIEMVDIDHDGILEMIFGDEYGITHILTQDDESSYVYNYYDILELPEQQAHWQSSPTVIDLDQDGLWDLFIGTWDGTIRHLEQTDAETFDFEIIQENFLGVVPSYNSSIEFADIDADGYPDVLIEGSSGYFLFLDTRETGNSVSGHITVDDILPTEYINVVAVSSDEEEDWEEVMTADDGSYVISDLPEGNYYIFAYSGDVPPTYFAETQEDGAFLWENATIVHIDNSIENIDINVSSALRRGGYVLSGNIADNQSENIESATILLLTPDGEVESFSYSNPEGDYSVNFLLEGNYEAIVTKLHYQSQTEAIYLDGDEWQNFTLSHLSSVDTQDEIISIDKISQATCYPNPFNPTNNMRGNGVNINFDLVKDSKVNIQIFNLKGQLVDQVLNKNLKKGNHNINWSGKNQNNKNVSTGIYFYKISSGTDTKVDKLLIVK